MKTCGQMLALGLFSVASVALGQVWIQQITPHYGNLDQLAVDKKGNSIVSGWINAETNAPSFLVSFDVNGQLRFSQQTTETVLLANVGPRFIGAETNVLFRISEDGERRALSPVQGNAILLQISACNEQSFVVLGLFSGSVRIGARSVVAPDVNSTFGFVARVNRNGNAIWLTQLPTSRIVSIAGTRKGGAYVLGETFEVFALNQHGKLSWSNSVSGNFYGGSVSIAADRLGRSYVAGYFRGHIETGAYSVTSIPGARTEAVMCALTSGGQHSFAWTLNDYSVANAVTTDRSGNWYAGGWYDRDNLGDGYITKNGKFGNENSVSGVGIQYVQSLVATDDRTIYVAGVSYPDSEILSSGGAFVAKFKLP